MAQLPKDVPVTTVRQAHGALNPLPVSKPPADRQGEWYFVEPTRKERVDIAKAERDRGWKGYHRGSRPRQSTHRRRVPLHPLQDPTPRPRSSTGGRGAHVRPRENPPPGSRDGALLGLASRCAQPREPGLRCQMDRLRRGGWPFKGVPSTRWDAGATVSGERAEKSSENRTRDGKRLDDA